MGLILPLALEAQADAVRSGLQVTDSPLHNGIAPAWLLAGDSGPLEVNRALALLREVQDAIDPPGSIGAIPVPDSGSEEDGEDDGDHPCDCICEKLWRSAYLPWIRLAPFVIKDKPELPSVHPVFPPPRWKQLMAWHEELKAAEARKVSGRRSASAARAAKRGRR
jgi:hypothetical protein